MANRNTVDRYVKALQKYELEQTQMANLYPGARAANDDEKREAAIIKSYNKWQSQLSKEVPLPETDPSYHHKVVLKHLTDKKLGGS